MIEVFAVKDSDKNIGIFPMITRDKILWWPTSGCKTRCNWFCRGIWSVDFRISDHNIKWPKTGVGQKFT